MLQAIPDADEATLRRSLGDIVALSTLTAVWAGARPVRIAESLGSALYTMLGAKLVYVALNDPDKGVLASIAQTGHYASDDDLAAQLGADLIDWARRRDPHELYIHDRPGAPGLRITCRQIGHNAELGVIAAGFVGEQAPAALHHLLLDVSATQATTGLNNALLVESLRRSEARLQEQALDLESLNRAVQSANETLEERVAERTRELGDAHEALRQSQKMEAVGQLTGGLAHDFNNLLGAISGSLDLMDHRLRQGRFADLEKYITMAQGASKRAAALTHRLLAFSRRQSLDPRPADMRLVIGGMVEMIQRAIGPAIHVDIQAEDDLWLTLVDISQVENALLNLCINARDAMPDGGLLTIATGNVALEAAAARKLDLPAGDYLSLSVADSGTGMAPDVVARAFDPFFTTKPLGEGTGLGLSMIYGFAQQSQGQVKITSTLGKGTSVRIFLPRYRGEAQADDEAAAAAPAASEAPGKVVLVVDDEPALRIILTDMLTTLGYRTIEAEDAAAAMIVLASPGPIDLLLTDVGLPNGMNGRQLADAARIIRPALHILFATGYAETALIRNGQLEPGMAVLTKPFSLDTLATKVRDFIALN